ncbi:MAG: hypothetical protein AB7O88_27935, partial [Reyranellaceae bacterium]
LDAGRRRAIEVRLDHNAARTEPAPNPSLVDELATQMAEAPHDFVRRDLVPLIAHLALPQWQRFRDWQAGLRRNDPATVDQIYAVKRGLQLAAGLPPAVAAGDEATNIRAGLVEDIDTQRLITGKSPDDTAIRDMVERSLPSTSIHSIRFPFDPPLNSSIRPAGLPLPKGGERRAIARLPGRTQETRDVPAGPARTASRGIHAGPAAAPLAGVCARGIASVAGGLCAARLQAADDLSVG